MITQCSNKLEKDLQVNEVVNERPSINLEKRIESKLTVSNEVFVERASIVRKNNIKISSNIAVLSEEEESWFSIEEAVYYVEAALNYDVSRAFGNEGKFYVHHSTTPLSTTINDSRVEASGTTLADIYSHFSAEITNHNPSGKTPLICNVWAEQDGDDYILAVDITYSEDLGQLGAWSANDDWWSNELLGKCDNTEVGKDAATRVGEMLNFYEYDDWDPNGTLPSVPGMFDPIEQCGGNTSGTWANVTDENFSGGSGTINTSNYGWWPYADCAWTCLDDQYMKNYLFDGMEAITDYCQTSGLEFAFVNTDPNYTVGLYLPGGSGCTPAHHFIYTVFGNFSCSAPLPW